MNRTGFSGPTWLSTLSGKSSVWDRSWPVMWDMPDSIKSNAAPESFRAGFSHGLLDWWNRGARAGSLSEW
jgi:hypothetical protein